MTTKFFKYFAATLLILIITTILAILVIQRFSDGPIEPMQGGPFRTGEVVTEPVTDWSFAAGRNIEFELVGPGTSRVAGFIMHNGQAYMTCDLGFIWNRFEDVGIDPFVRQTAVSSLDTPNPQLMVYGLEIDGKLRATLAGGIHQGQFSGCFISLADDDYSHISPGELIIHLVTRDCTERGIKVFDLGRGEERFKSSWCDTTITMFETNSALTYWGVGFAAYERAKLTVKRAIRSNQTLWNLAKKARARLYGRM